MTRLAGLLAALALLAGGIAACGGDGGGTATAADPHGATVRIGVLRGSGPLNLAQADGSLAKAVQAKGATVKWTGPFPAMAPAIEAMNAGDVDITMGSITAGIGALAGRSDFTIFARQVADGKAEGIVVKPGSGITSIEGLKGKKVAVNRGGTGEYLLLKALDTDGLSPDDVQRVYLAPTDAGPAFGSGKVDAWATWSAFTALAENQYHAKLIADGGQIGSQNDVVYIVRTKFLQQYPTLVTAVFDALRARAQQAAADPDGTAKIIARLQKVPLPVATAQAASSEQTVDPIDAAIVKRYQGVADYFADKKVVPSRVDVSKRTADVRTLGG